MKEKRDKKKKVDKEKEKKIRICEMISREVPPAAYEVPYKPVCLAKNKE
jgi:hypothetical protein